MMRFPMRRAMLSADGCGPGEDGSSARVTLVTRDEGIRQWTAPDRSTSRRSLFLALPVAWDREMGDRSASLNAPSVSSAIPIEDRPAIADCS